LEAWGKDEGHIKPEPEVTYEFEMAECGPNPYYLMPRMFNEPMFNMQCFYIVSGGPWGYGSDLAFEVDEQDKYYPKHYGIYDIRVKEYKGRAANNKAQQFVYNTEDHTVRSLIHPETAIFEGVNMNLVMYKNINMENQHWEYSSVHKTWKNMHSNDFIRTDQFKVDANVRTVAIDDESPNIMW
jgi:hypothetical protein